MNKVFSNKQTFFEHHQFNFFIVIPFFLSALIFSSRRALSSSSLCSNPYFLKSFKSYANSISFMFISEKNSFRFTFNEPSIFSFFAFSYPLSSSFDKWTLFRGSKPSIYSFFSFCFFSRELPVKPYNPPW